MEDLIIDKALPATGAHAVVDIGTMKVLVYYAPGEKSWEDHAKPVIEEPTDATIRLVDTVTTPMLFKTV